MMRLGFSRNQAASEKFQSNGLLRIAVRNIFNFPLNAYFDSEFLHQLPKQAVLERLARLNLATRKFPQTAEVIVQPSLGD